MDRLITPDAMASMLAPMNAVNATGVSHMVLLSALEDRQRGLVICDSKLRICHVTSRTFEVLGIEARHPVRASTVEELFAYTAFTAVSVLKAISAISEYADDSEEPVVVLSSRDDERCIWMRLRNLSGGYRAAVFELAPTDHRVLATSSGAATEDIVTGLSTRAAFEEAVRNALLQSRESSVAVLLIDLDRFKAINDTLGHNAGDVLLRLVAERLRAAVRHCDVVARFGGDEFAVLLSPVSGRDHVATVAERILDLLQRTYLIDGQLANVGASLGIALSPGDGNDCRTLMMSADLALYESKESGRATFRFFDVDMNIRAQARRTNELELRRALALRQLQLHYQPQVTIDGGLVGFEALLRWQHPTRGLIPPNDFIPLAEKIGAIIPIGEWVLRTAAQQAVNWPSHIVLAVNASPIQIEAGNFAEAVRRALAGTGLPGHRLEIEITEGVLLGNGEVVMRTLNELRALGVRIAMDDFGTGYASLSQLARFPFDKIKIDRSLAGAEGDDLKKRAIIRAITALGQSLGACTLAEGVEDHHQLARLHSDGCASVQGYLFGKPVPAAELQSVIARLSATQHQ